MEWDVVAIPLADFLASFTLSQLKALEILSMAEFWPLHSHPTAG